MRYKELQGLSKNDLEEKELELAKELMKDNAQVATGTTPKSPGKIKVLKKDIARIRTLLNVKQKSSEVKKQ